MRFEEYRAHDATALAGLVAQGAVTPRELFETALARAEALQPALGAISVFDLEDAERRLAGPLPDGPFRGVPFLLKDLYAFLEGTRLTNGSRLTRDLVAPFTATFVRRCLDAGLVPFGKTTSPEFGLNVTTEPVLHGPARNPWNPAFSAGGSSGGAAVAVAAGIVPLAHATDGGGSIRIPASHCGLVGLKPSRARTPMGPVVVEAWNGFATGLCLARSLRDVAGFLDAVHGPEPGDFYAAPPPSGPFLAALDREPGPLRVGLWRKPVEPLPVHEAVDTAVVRAARLLESLGHHVEETEVPLDGAKLLEDFVTVVSVNLARDVGVWSRLVGRPADAGHLEACTLAIAERGRAVAGTDFLGALQTLQGTARVFGRLFERFDVLLSPTCAAPPPPLGTIDQNGTDPGAFLRANRPYVVFTALYNVSGCPAISLPLGTGPEGLPVGVMLGARLGGEETLLSLAAEIERAAPWSDRLPPV
jgi:Asp-tRNA(Asn)/Glu-tRNA(Gln) amidotransferase A subunit family amidase